MDIQSIGNAIQSGASVAERRLSETEQTVAVRQAALPVDVTAQVQQPASVPNLPQVNQAVEKINKAMAAMSQSLEFSVDDDSDRTIVKVVDLQTKEIIRQMPTKEALEIAKALDRALGLLIKQNA